MGFSKEFIKKIRDCGISQYSSQFTKLEKRGNLFIGRCPHPDHNDSDPSFRIFIDENGENFSCMGCGYYGKKDNDKQYHGNDNISFVRWMSDNRNSNHVLTFNEAVRELANFYHIPIEYDEFSEIYKKNREEAYRYHMNLLDTSNNDSVQAVKYLYNRGLDGSDIVKWGLGYNGDRITFPITNASSDVVGFSNRAFSDASIKSGSKYVNTANSISFQKNGVLYGIQYFNKHRNHVLLVEGQIDTILAHKYGVDFAIAPMTCHVSDSQAEWIKKNNKIPILCFDGDEAGQKGTAESAEKLRQHGVSIIKYLPLTAGMDMADLANNMKDNLCEYIHANMCLYNQYEINKLLDRFDSGVNELIIGIMPDINNKLKDIKDNVERGIIKNLISKRLHLWKDDDILCP